MALFFDKYSYVDWFLPVLSSPLNIMRNLLIFGFIICLASACSDKMNPNKSDTVNASQLANTKWELIKLGGLKLPVEAKATLQFTDSLIISGKSFCNNYGGQAMVNDGKLAFDKVFSTKMFCQDVADAENTYLKALNEATMAQVKNSTLVLSNGAKELLVYKKVD